MKSIQAEYDNALDKIIIKTGARVEDWQLVCARFNHEVSRIRNVANQGEYTGLYQCFNQSNQLFFYMVQEENI